MKDELGLDPEMGNCDCGFHVYTFLCWTSSFFLRRLYHFTAQHKSGGEEDRFRNLRGILHTYQ